MIKERNNFPSQMVTFLTYKTFEYKNKCERNLPKLQIKIQSELEACTFNTAWHCCSHYELHLKKRKTSYKLTGGYVMFCYNMSLYNKGHFS